MGFDVLSTSTFDKANEGTFMAFLDPHSGDPYVDDEGKPQGVTLRSRLSKQGQEFAQAQGMKRLEMSRRGQEVSVATIESETTDLLVACTVSWTFTHLDGKDFSFSPENARAFWSDPRFRTHRERANVWIGNEANFTKR